MQVCCRVLTGECSPCDEAEDSDSPWWQLVGVLLPPFLHGVCMCVDRPCVAEGLLPPLVSEFALLCRIQLRKANCRSREEAVRCLEQHAVATTNASAHTQRFLPGFVPCNSQLLTVCRALQVRLSEVLSERINRNPTEGAAASMAEDILRQTQLTNPQEGLALAPSGWHPVKASFEVDKVTCDVCTECPRFPVFQRT